MEMHTKRVQVELNLLKCTSFKQFLHFWTCPEEYVRTLAIAEEAMTNHARDCGRDYDSDACTGVLMYVYVYFFLYCPGIQRLQSWSCTERNV